MAHALNAPGVPATGATWSQAVQDGEWVFISGQVAMDADGSVIGPRDGPRQAEEVFRRIESLLAAAGGSFADVRKMTVFVTDMRVRGDVTAVRNRYAREPYPTSTLVQVAALVHPDLVVEVDVIARVPPGGQGG